MNDDKESLGKSQICPERTYKVWAVRRIEKTASWGYNEETLVFIDYDVFAGDSHAVLSQRELVTLQRGRHLIPKANQFIFLAREIYNHVLDSDNLMGNSPLTVHNVVEKCLEKGKFEETKRAKREKTQEKSEAIKKQRKLRQERELFEQLKKKFVSEDADEIKR